MLVYSKLIIYWQTGKGLTNYFVLAQPDNFELSKNDEINSKLINKQMKQQIKIKSLMIIHKYHIRMNRTKSAQMKAKFLKKITNYFFVEWQTRKMLYTI